MMNDFHEDDYLVIYVDCFRASSHVRLTRSHVKEVDSLHSRQMLSDKDAQ